MQWGDKVYQRMESILSPRVDTDSYLFLVIMPFAHLAFIDFPFIQEVKGKEKDPSFIKIGHGSIFKRENL